MMSPPPHSITWSDRLRAALCTGLWFGYSPFISGTVGTVPAVIIYVVIVKMAPSDYHTGLILLALLVSSALCVALGSWSERFWGRKDPGQVVLDEIAGFFLTVLLFRPSTLPSAVVWSFVATRFFDVVKPPPAYQLQSLPAGWGILVDDLVASLYAVAALHLMYWIFPGLFVW
jgi:phosphatidylglycerophosphatase A